MGYKVRPANIEPPSSFAIGQKEVVVDNELLKSIPSLQEGLIALGHRLIKQYDGQTTVDGLQVVGVDFTSIVFTMEFGNSQQNTGE